MQYYVQFKKRAQDEHEVLDLNLNSLDGTDRELPSRTVDDITPYGRYQVCTELAAPSREFILGRMALLQQTIAMCARMIDAATTAFQACS